MFLVFVLRNALLFLVPVSLFLTIYLYAFPVFHACAFPAPDRDASSAYFNTVRQHAPFLSHDATAIAPFRLLALGDPQLEGDTSIDPNALSFPYLKKLRNNLLLNNENRDPWQRARHSLHDLVDFYFDDIPRALEVYRKRLDHVGNDYYLGHIYRKLHWWTDPSHVTVLGDLVGSQWIDDEEFESRGWRFWNRVFRHAERVPDELMSQPADDFQHTKELGEDAAGWKRRLINVAGNHDIGYAGDLTPERLSRFVRMYGKANYELRFHLPLDLKLLNQTSSDQVDLPGEPPELRIVLLNDMNLDTPAFSSELQDETYNFLNTVITTSHKVTRKALFTLVLTHIPLYKDAGICVDGPFFDFYEDGSGHGVKEQNHLSLDASKGFLEGIFGMSGSPNADGGGMGRRGLIMNGHDHEGCDIYHFINQTSFKLANEEYEKLISEDVLAEHLVSRPELPPWQAKRLRDAQAENLPSRTDLPGIQEATVRSMMGDFGGNAGLVSLWFDYEAWEWKYEFVNCALGTQHIWWLVHIVDLIVMIMVIVWAILSVVERVLGHQAQLKQRSHLNGAEKHSQGVNGNAGNKKLDDYNKIDLSDFEHVQIDEGWEGYPVSCASSCGAKHGKNESKGANGVRFSR
ncbi:hypothetical protein BP5796_06884 [Coleophoma crateriformis]|uniref:Calcineurin-like phosphoesterase domain-containing protein n=1 Tax=Coleophoma crateriformis TaxID=565419 RepID=A0A3D8RPS8_9HELO|nr:hypothetical protein BP5796_06884 [Coleophoma crateriformis]